MGKEKVVAAFEALASFVPESKPPGFAKSNDMYTEGDEKCEFYSEGFLYPLFGFKDDARSMMSRLRALKEAIDEIPPQMHQPIAYFEVEGRRFAVFEIGDAQDRPLIEFYRKLYEAVDKAKNGKFPEFKRTKDPEERRKQALEIDRIRRERDSSIADAMGRCERAERKLKHEL